MGICGSATSCIAELYVRNIPISIRERNRIVAKVIEMRNCNAAFGVNGLEV